MGKNIQIVFNFVSILKSRIFFTSFMSMVVNIDYKKILNELRPILFKSLS